MINGWQSHYGTLPVVSGDIDNYRIEFFFEYEGLNDGLSGTLNDTLNGTLNEGLKTLLDIIKTNRGIKAKDISKKDNRPIDTVKKQIKTLGDIGFIERRGSKKTGGYWVRQRNNQH